MLPVVSSVAGVRCRPRPVKRTKRLRQNGTADNQAGPDNKDVKQGNWDAEQQFVAKTNPSQWRQHQNDADEKQNRRTISRPAAFCLDDVAFSHRPNLRALRGVATRKLVHGGGQVCVGERLGQKKISPIFDRCFPVLTLPLGGQHQDRQGFRLLFAA